MSNGKGMIIVLIVGLIKKTSYVFRNTSCKQHIKMSQYFPKPFNSHFGDRVKVYYWSKNYATKSDVKNISHVDTSSFALKLI